MEALSLIRSPKYKSWLYLLISLETGFIRNLDAGGSLPKTQFSQFPSELWCNHKYEFGLKHGVDNMAEAVVAQAEALVFQQPDDGALNRTAPLAQPRPVGLPALVQTRFGTVHAA